MQKHFVATAGWGHACIFPVAGDASMRRYYRLMQGPLPWSNAILMDAGDQSGQSIRSFMAVGSWLAERKFSSPTLIAADVECGFLLLEDFGETLFLQLCAQHPELEDELYGAAADLLRHLHTVDAPTVLSHGATLPEHNLMVYVRQTRIVLEHFAPRMHTPAAERHLDQLIADACGGLTNPMPVLVHRDFHAGNLFWLPDRPAHARVGLIDYQDALAGHPAYDLVSLLQDARRDISPELEHRILARYFGGRAVPETFRRDYAVLGAQRNLRILGIFARAARLQNKTAYLDLIPRVWRYVMRDLEHPDLEDLRNWVQNFLPAPSDLSPGTDHR